MHGGRAPEKMSGKWPSANQYLENPIVSRAVATLLLALLVWAVVRSLRRLATHQIENNRLRYRIRKTIGAIGWVFIVVASAAIFSDRLGGLAISLGVAGAGIAFALQEVIASFAGRVAIAFANFYKTGDRVQLGGIKGDVIDIGLLRTTIMEVGDWVKGDLFTGRVVRIANSFVFKEPVFNYSGDFGFLWDEITVPVKYGCDHNDAKRLLQEITEQVTGEYATEAQREWKLMLEKYSVERAGVLPMVTLVANDNWMEYTIRYVVPYTMRRTTKDALFTKILDAVNASQGAIVLASATFHLVDATPLRVRMMNGPTGALGS